MGQQQPAPDEATKPLTQDQQREKQIHVYDPLDAGNPLNKTAPPDANGVNRDNSDRDNGAPTAPPAPGPPAAKPLAGSVASSNQKPVTPQDDGPRVVSGDPDENPVQEYTGPAVLSRSYTVSRPLMPQEVRWKPFVGVSGIYDSGLTGSGVDANGSLLNGASYGAMFDWGLSGRHFWKQDQVGLDYRGEYNRYNAGSPYNGSNQFLNLDYTHAFSRRLALNLIETGSIYSQSFTLENPAMGGENSMANIDLAASPTVQIFDSGLRQSTTIANMTWHKSARLSFNYGGGFFAVDRTGLQLYGNIGYQAQADVNYRYTRKLTLGLYYSFIDYTFAKHIQVTDANTMGAIVSYAINRSTQIRLRAGGTRLETEGLTTVVIPPEIAALLGQTTGIVESYHVGWVSDISAEVVKDFKRKRTARLAYARGVAPGNGAILTSTQESISGGFTMLVLRRYLVSTGVGRTTLSAFGQALGKYQTDYAFLAVSRDYNHGISGNFRFDYRKFDITGAPWIHDQLRVTLGFAWSPGEGPLKFW